MLFKVFKIATSCYEPLNNYMVFNDVDGIYTYNFESERKVDCLACSNVPRPVPVDDPNTMTLENLIAFLCESAEFQMKSPGKCTKCTNTTSGYKYCSSLMLKRGLQKLSTSSRSRSTYTCKDFQIAYRMTRIGFNSPFSVL